jgi:hypothetical protein
LRMLAGLDLLLGFGSGQPARKRVQQFNNFSMREWL